MKKVPLSVMQGNCLPGRETCRLSADGLIDNSGSIAASDGGFAETVSDGLNNSGFIAAGATL
ncbi:hypothetical protein BG910_01530 [Neisseria chenwenguii]|uniref:Uncharacterized protein n=1 Tax=Neisseria chenwenguii TaxID=1853278 RepID=A0A220RZE3_9NEIS|nr:hypothetical protein BG910_01530 [Neisseria chenwenguii]